MEANGHEEAPGILSITTARLQWFRDEGRKLLMVHSTRTLDRYTLEIPAGALDFPEGSQLDCALRSWKRRPDLRRTKKDGVFNPAYEHDRGLL